MLHTNFFHLSWRVILMIIGLAISLCACFLAKAHGAELSDHGQDISLWDQANPAMDANCYCAFTFQRTATEICMTRVANPFRMAKHFVIVLKDETGQEISNSQTGSGWELRDGYMFFKIPEKFQDKKIHLTVQMKNLFPTPASLCFEPEKLYRVNLVKAKK